MIPAFPEIPGVEFRPIPDHDGYIAGSDGSIWSCRVPGSATRRADCWRELKQNASGNGWPVLVLCGESRPSGQRPRTYRVADLILLTFHGPRPANSIVDRPLNDDLADNRACNLRWCPRPSQAEIRRRGMARSGRRGPAKVDDAMVAEMRRLRVEGETLLEIAARFGVSESAVSLATNGKRWKHVPMPDSAYPRNQGRKGSLHGQAMTDEATVLQMRRLRAEGRNTVEIAKQFGLPESLVRQAVYGMTWKHVPMP